MTIIVKTFHCNYLVLSSNFAETDLQLAQVLLSNYLVISLASGDGHHEMGPCELQSLRKLNWDEPIF